MEQKIKLKPLEQIRYLLLLGTCKVIGALPSWLLYHGLLDVIYFFLYVVARYRVKVVRQNLAGSFPEMSQKELRSIEKKYYLHLAEVFIDTIDIVGIGRRAMAKRMTFVDTQTHDDQLAGRSWIAALAHYGSWEYFATYQIYTPDVQVVGVYKALHDRAFNKFYNYARGRFGSDPVDRKNILRYMVTAQRENKQIAVGLISDQNAKPGDQVMWHDFLNRKTLFFVGIEKLAVKFSMPVYYVDVTKLGRARYKSEFVMIYDGSEKIEQGQIIERYARALEKTIRRDPPYWMWSHRRWKVDYNEYMQERAKKSKTEENQQPLTENQS